MLAVVVLYDRDMGDYSSFVNVFLKLYIMKFLNKGKN